MKILVAYEGSDLSEKILEFVKKRAKLFNAEVYLVTSKIGGREVPRQEFVTAEKDLEYAENLLKDDGISCETHLLVRGLYPGEDVVQFAQEKEFDEIIVGVKKRSKVGKFLLGSTAQYVILEAPCPVVSVK
ncbi:MAG: universal stress protein [Desulfobacteraceae bacterium]|nr:universal stress protein [Desulfobacteraceae bacterium]